MKPTFPRILLSVFLLFPIRAFAHTVEERVRQYGPIVEKRMRPYFESAGVNYPPASLSIVVLKTERRLELYAGDKGRTQAYIRTFPILAASGVPGPKLAQGDMQVPEGIYRIDALNPDSMFHLSLHVNYPNVLDRKRAAKEGRANLGGDIMIHGNAVSIGCVAIGDEGAEDLFVLAARVGLPHIKVIMSPTDLRTTAVPATPRTVARETKLVYEEIRRELEALPPRHSATPR